MTLFCYGILLHVLNLCSPRKTTQKFLCGTMFLSINPSYDIRDDDGTVGHLKNCSNEISPSITDVIDSADVETIRTCFEKQIIPKLYPNEVSTVIAALAHIVANAGNIEENVRIGTISKLTKARFYDRHFGGSSGHLPKISIQIAQNSRKKSEVRSLFRFTTPGDLQKPSYQRQR